MAKPDTLCKLSKGKIIDSADGFVDTFNWLVDFCSNLKGPASKFPAQQALYDQC